MTLGYKTVLANLCAGEVHEDQMSKLEAMMGVKPDSRNSINYYKNLPEENQEPEDDGFDP